MNSYSKERWRREENESRGLSYSMERRAPVRRSYSCNSVGTRAQGRGLNGEKRKPSTRPDASKSAESTNQKAEKSAESTKQKAEKSAESTKRKAEKSAESVNSKEGKSMKGEAAKSSEDSNEMKNKQKKSAEDVKQKEGNSARERNPNRSKSTENCAQFALPKIDDMAYNEDRSPELVMRSLLRSMRASMSAHDRSNNERADLHSLTRTLLTLIMFVLFLVIGILEIIIGAVKVGKCPIRPIIPIWLLISGLMNLFRNTLGIIFAIWEDKQGRTAAIRDVIMGGLVALWIIWLILGSYWVYDIYNIVSYERDTKNYCDQLVYSFTFILVTLTYVLLGILLCCTCYCVVFLCCHNSSVIIIT